MTEEEAREACKRLALDPDKKVPAPSPVSSNGWTNDVYMEERQWQAIQREGTRLRAILGIQDAP